MLKFITTSPEETAMFGKCLGQVLQSGHTVCLAGDLGAGKTLLVQGMAETLEIEDGVNSPTFTILNVYQGRLPVYHFDLYRLEQPEELFDIGFYEYTATDGLAIIEWPDKFPEELPEERLWIDIAAGDLPSQRMITVYPQGSCYGDVCEELKKICPFLR